MSPSPLFASHSLHKQNKMTNERNNLVEALRSVELIEGLNPTIYVRDDGDIVLSAEEYDGAANEYDYSIHPNIEAVMSKFGYVFEWETSGSLIAYKI